MRETIYESKISNKQLDNFHLKRVQKFPSKEGNPPTLPLSKNFGWKHKINQAPSLKESWKNAEPFAREQKHVLLHVLGKQRPKTEISFCSKMLQIR